MNFQYNHDSERILQHPLLGNTEYFRLLIDFERYYVDKAWFIKNIIDSSSGDYSARLTEST